MNRFGDFQEPALLDPKDRLLVVRHARKLRYQFRAQRLAEFRAHRRQRRIVARLQTKDLEPVGDLSLHPFRIELILLRERNLQDEECHKVAVAMVAVHLLRLFPAVLDYVTLASLLERQNC
nr:hypothetical protein [Sphingomonas metalli]